MRAGGALTGREGVDVEGHVLVLAVHHVQQVGADGPFGGVGAEVQDHHAQHCEHDADGLLARHIPEGQAWWAQAGRPQLRAPPRCPACRAAFPPAHASWPQAQSPLLCVLRPSRGVLPTHLHGWGLRERREEGPCASSHCVWVQARAPRALGSMCLPGPGPAGMSVGSECTGTGGTRGCRGRPPTPASEKLSEGPWPAPLTGTTGCRPSAQTWGQAPSLKSPTGLGGWSMGRKETCDTLNNKKGHFITFKGKKKSSHWQKTTCVLSSL